MELNFETFIGTVFEQLGNFFEVPKSEITNMYERARINSINSKLKSAYYYRELTNPVNVDRFNEYSSIVYVDKEYFDGTSFHIESNPNEKYTNITDEIESFLLHHDEIMKKSYIRAFIYFTYSEFRMIGQSSISYEGLPVIKRNIRNDNDVEAIFSATIHKIDNDAIYHIHNSVLNVGMSLILYNKFWDNAYMYSNTVNNPFKIQKTGVDNTIGTSLIEMIYDSFTVTDSLHEDSVELYRYNDYENITTERVN